MPENTKNLSDFERYLLLAPIVAKLGVEEAKLIIGTKVYTDDELTKLSEDFLADWTRSNDEFGRRLENDSTPG